MYAARVLADSVSPAGKRITSLEVVLPRFLLAELNTHRALSRNAGSSRAVPVATMLKRVKTNPFVPERFGINQKGMQAENWLTGAAHDAAVAAWLEARDSAVQHAERQLELNVHKQTANRLLEPFMWITDVVTATEWSNFYALRAHPDAQPEFQRIAVMMRAAMEASTPRELGPDEWHLPLVEGVDLDRLVEEGRTMTEIVQISAGRCARVSHLTHDGVRDPDKDIELCLDLTNNGHMSPLEHPARPLENPTQPLGNFVGWEQYRKLIANEHDFSLLQGNVA